MKVSSLNKGGGLFSGAAITGNKTITEKDLNNFFIVTAAATITLPKPQDIKAVLGESLLLMSMTENVVSITLSAGATIDSYSGSMELLKGMPMDLIVTSGTTWAIRGVRAATDTEITAGLDKTRYLTPLEHAEHHLKDIPGYNYVINGNFDIWQRGTSQTTNGYGSDDRWFNFHAGCTKSNYKMTLPIGMVVPSEAPLYNYCGITVASVAGADNYCMKAQRIEGVNRLAGKKVTLSFYASGAGLKMGVEFTQKFGTGGSPSAQRVNIGNQQITLTAGLTRYVMTVDIPSVSGKTLGTNNDDCLELLFWFDAGTTYATRASNIGHQSGLFYITRVSLVEGDVDIKPIPRSYGEELTLCQRYYSTGFAHTRSYATAITQTFNTPIYFPAIMRAVPTLAIKDGGGRANVVSVGISAPAIGSARHEIVSAAAGDCRALLDIWTADAEL